MPETVERGRVRASAEPAPALAREPEAAAAEAVYEDRTPSWLYRLLVALALVALFVTWLFWRTVGGALRAGFLLEFLLFLGLLAFATLRLSRKNRWRERTAAWTARQRATMARLAAGTREGLASGTRGFVTGFKTGEEPNFVVRILFRFIRAGLWVYRKVRAVVLFLWRIVRFVLRLAYRIVRWALRTAWRIVYWVLRWWPIRYATRWAEPRVLPRVEPVLLKTDVEISRLLLLAIAPEKLARYEELGLGRREPEEEEAPLEAAPERPAPKRRGLFRRREEEPAPATPLPTAADTPHRPDDVIEIEGIGEARAERLRALGVDTTQDLLGWEPRALAGKLGEPETTVAKWLAMADLMRVDGIGKQYAEVLARIGVTGIEDLVDRDPKRLAAAAAADQASLAVTIQKNPVTVKRVKGWIGAAETWRKRAAQERAQRGRAAARSAPQAAVAKGK